MLPLPPLWLCLRLATYCRIVCWGQRNGCGRGVNLRGVTGAAPARPFASNPQVGRGWCDEEMGGRRSPAQRVGARGRGGAGALMAKCAGLGEVATPRPPAPRKPTAARGGESVIWGRNRRQAVPGAARGGAGEGEVEAVLRSRPRWGSSARGGRGRTEAARRPTRGFANHQGTPCWPDLVGPRTARRWRWGRLCRWHRHATGTAPKN